MKMEVGASPPVNRGGRKQVKVGTNKRNARERNRVRYINNCFEVLREHIPVELVVGEQKNRKLSKVETLKYAAIYIKKLNDLLNNNEQNVNNFEAKNQGESINYDNGSQFASNSNLYYNNNQSTINNKIENKTSSSIQFNNININIYDSKAANEYLHSPALSSASSSSSSSSFGPCFNNTYAQSYSDGAANPKLPVYFNCGKTSSLMMSSFLNSNNSYGHVNNYN
jgi:achaete-scute complex protein